jgi:hypothetical protein
MWQLKSELKKYFRSSEVRCDVTRNAAYMLRLESPLINDDEDDCGQLCDLISDEAAENERGELLKEGLSTVLNRLTGRESDLFQQRYLLQAKRQTYVDLGPRFGVTAERLRQLDPLNEIREEFLERTPLYFGGRKLVVNDHESRDFIDEYWNYRQLGIGSLRRRRNADNLAGAQPKLQNGDCCPIVYCFNYEEIAAFVAARPDVLLPHRPPMMPVWIWASVYRSTHTIQTSNLQRVNRAGLEDGMRCYRTTSLSLKDHLGDHETIAERGAEQDDRDDAVELKPASQPRIPLAGRHYWRDLGGGCRVRYQSPALLAKRPLNKEAVTREGEVLAIRVCWAGPQPRSKQKKNKQPLGPTIINFAKMKQPEAKLPKAGPTYTPAHDSYYDQAVRTVGYLYREGKANVILFPKRPLNLSEGLFVELRGACA